MKSQSSFILILLLATIQYSEQTELDGQSNNVFRLHYVEDELAKCLDGTQPSFYFNQGFDEGKNKFIVYFQGAAWINGFDRISTLTDAWFRSESIFGSSKLLPATMQWNSGIFSRNPQVNPHFYNWNAVYINSCDGTGYQGFRKDPIFWYTRFLYFRGEANTKGVIKTLQEKYNFENAEFVYLSGCSAGGLAIFNWANYFRGLFPNSTQVVAAPDSGLFLDLPRANGDSFHRYSNNYFKSFMQFSNVEVDPINTKCVEANPNEKWKCLMSQYLIDYIDIPLMFIQSQYDSWSIPFILGVDCVYLGLFESDLNTCTAEQMKYIEEHRQVVSEVITNALQKNKQWASWVTSCVNHCFIEMELFNSPRYNVPEDSGNTISQALHNWITNLDGDNRHYDKVSWPHNTKCAREIVKQSDL